MQTAYVFKLAQDLWGLLVYRPETEVLALHAEVACSVHELCTSLSSIGPTEFRPADLDQAAWGRVIAANRQGGEMVELVIEAQSEGISVIVTLSEIPSVSPEPELAVA